jgi:hypothetical protein
VWKEHGLKPRLARSFKLSNDPQFAEKMQDIVGLYLDPPERTFNVSGKRSLWRWCYRLTERARYKRWIAPSPACP